MSSTMLYTGPLLRVALLVLTVAAAAVATVGQLGHGRDIVVAAARAAAQLAAASVLITAIVTSLSGGRTSTDSRTRPDSTVHRRGTKAVVAGGSVRDDGGMSVRSRFKPDAQCPIRPGEPCTLCQLGATGPQDCGLVYLVMTDDELRDGLHEARMRTRNLTPLRTS
jgi:hypothetical protein